MDIIWFQEIIYQELLNHRINHGSSPVNIKVVYPWDLVTLAIEIKQSRNQWLVYSMRTINGTLKAKGSWDTPIASVCGSTYEN